MQAPMKSSEHPLNLCCRRICIANPSEHYIRKGKANHVLLQIRRMASVQPEDTVYSGPQSAPPRRVTLRTIRQMYAKNEPLSMVTAYDYPSAVHVSSASCHYIAHRMTMLHLATSLLFPLEYVMLTTQKRRMICSWSSSQRACSHVMRCCNSIQCQRSGFSNHTLTPAQWTQRA